MESPLVKEYYDWKNLIRMPEWQNYLAILQNQREYLQREVNDSVEKGDINKANFYLGQLRFIPLLAGKVEKRINNKPEEE